MLDLLELKNSGKINTYCYKQIANRIAELPIPLQHKMLSEALIMSDIGVNSEEDHKNFAYIAQHTRKIAEDIANESLNKELVAKISHLVFQNKHILPINTIYNFYKAVGAALGKADLKKVSYPVSTGTNFENASAPYNMDKWMQSMQDIYKNMSRGYHFSDSFDLVTKDWDDMEKYDYKGWLRFHQEGAHEKYKTAQQYYQSDESGSPMLPMSHLEAKLPSQAPDMPNMSRFQHAHKYNDDDEAVKVKKQISSLVRRLQAAEKIFTEPEVQRALKDYLDMGLADWLKRLHNLKGEIQMARVRVADSPIFNDIIIKHSNQLSSIGFPKAGALLVSVAQSPRNERSNQRFEGKQIKAPTVEEVKAEQAQKVEQPVSEIPPTEMPPSQSPAPNLSDPALNELMSFDNAAPIDEGSQAMQEFINGMNSRFSTDDGEEDEHDSDDQALISVTAQMIPDRFAPKEKPVELPKEEIVPDIIADEEEAVSNHNGHAEMDDDVKQLLSNVTVSSIIEQLELTANVLRTRELPRRFSIIDLMMDEVDMAGMFPMLAEAHRSGLESNQYQLTRVEDALSKMRSSLKVDTKVELTHSKKEKRPSKEDSTIQQVRENLKQRKAEERERKDQRAQGDELKPTVQIAPPELEQAKPVIERAPPTVVR